MSETREDIPPALLVGQATIQAAGVWGRGRRERGRQAKPAREEGEGIVVDGDNSFCPSSSSSSLLWEG